MTSTSPTPREQRFEQLRAEINDLIARYPDMPPGRPQSVCQSEIDKRFKEIDALNAEEYADQLASQKQQSASHSTATSGQRQGAAVAMVMIAVGLLFHSYTIVAAGGGILLLCMGVLGRRSTPQAADTAKTAEPSRERFQWRP